VGIGRFAKRLILNHFPTILIVAGLVLAYITWQVEVQRRKVDNSLRYIDLMTENNFTRQLYAVAEFTLCFEKKRGLNLSYLSKQEFDDRKIKAYPVRACDAKSG
jgi:hypothetical protein